MEKKPDPYCAWLVRAEQMSQMLDMAERLNIRKSVFNRLLLKYVLLFTGDNFVVAANAGKLHGEYSLPAPKLIAWLQIDVQATLAATVEKIDIAKTESDVVRMAISYVFDFHLAEFLQHLEEAYTFRHIREPLEK